MSFKWALNRSKRVLSLEGAELNQAISAQLGSSDDTNFAGDIASLLSLPLPEPTDCYEDWIHTEQGARGRWIVRLVRFFRAARVQPWQSKELYVAEGDEQTDSMATAYGRAWLFSHTTWPPAVGKPDYRLAS
jgi:hypothetical protein